MLSHSPSALKAIGKTKMRSNAYNGRCMMPYHAVSACTERIYRNSSAAYGVVFPFSHRGNFYHKIESAVAATYRTYGLNISCDSEYLWSDWVLQYAGFLFPLLQYYLWHGMYYKYYYLPSSRRIFRIKSEKMELNSWRSATNSTRYDQDLTRQATT